tara:strand:- start:1312 stop:1794 length:483 start_codon:yes stop_codon:yes gene_type:complete
MSKKENVILIIILSTLSLFLISAYIIEYGLGHKPCNLCLYQRIPYFISIGLILTILLIKKYEKTNLLILSLVSIAGACLAFYHVGIEYGFFSEAFCEVKKILSDNSDYKQLLKDLKDNPLSCKNVTFRIFGLSLATINTIFSLGLSAIFTKLFIDYGKNK